jgi:hypothetical protein
MTAVAPHSANQALGPPTPISSNKIQARLAYELAANLMTPSEVFQRFGLNKQQARAILANPQFRTLYAEAKVVWNSAESTKDRIRAKAGMMVEDSLLALWQILHDGEVAPPSRLAAFKEIVQVANLGPPRASEGPGESGPRFTLTINIPGSPGHEAKSVTIDAETAETDSTDV